MALIAIDNPPNPWHAHHVEWLDAPPPAEFRVYEERCASILSMNRSPDVGFTWSVNPYRGCQHGCAYCYARPSHQRLDFGAGTDFERRIVVKVNAAEKLAEAFDRPGWAGERVVFSGNTDCYQPLEASYGLTRALLSVCAAYRNPVGVITRSAIIRRDVDILAELATVADVSVYVSVPFADARLARRLEPGAPTPRVRFETMRVLADAGIRVGVAVAPIIPGLNDEQVVDVLEAARDAGAGSAFLTLLRLPDELPEVFLPRLRDAAPCILAGPTCDSADVLYEKTPYPLPVSLTIGDEVLIEGTGAYTTTYSAVAFNGFEPLHAYVI